MNVRVQDVRYFLAVAEELSFTRAAERLFVSQPALSKQVRQLEAQLRAELFTRGHRMVGLTAAGAAFLPRARAIVAEWEAAAEDVRLAGRTLTVGFHSRIGRGLVPTITATMQQRLPGWRLQFRQIPWGDPAVGLTAGTVDAALAWLPVPSGLSTRPIATEDRGVALPAGHRLAGRSSLRFADIADEPFVALPASAGPMRDFWLALDHRTSSPSIAAEATTSDEAYEIVAAGEGVLLQPAGSCSIHQREDVVHRPVIDLPPARLAVVWRSGDHRAAVRVVTDACFHCASPPLAPCGIMAG
ncbi:LysR family transcriptional regulator [Pseudonocardia sp. DSM 110487]|uniref:LysR family transcriptional regulator n=1 Tax=Pseudonocardia sp. DSM 110487 TaxID=2865833 RepID=UPI001C6A5E2F|nr:LysR family transcriptional regulator [Pseudonocardia sp. DSM 110487]QYN34816.1 LysR family transcriptional regulator [Pseudonocardia sp. DSM 110487]